MKMVEGSDPPSHSHAGAAQTRTGSNHHGPESSFPLCFAKLVNRILTDMKLAALRGGHRSSHTDLCRERELGHGGNMLQGLELRRGVVLVCGTVDAAFAKKMKVPLE